ncbi:MAG: ThiF family adenylyltransferase [Gemmatimonadaceae bacterium]|nr:ThiF family adenylyltransferase [Gemmatimonadaceae bacterium]
MTARSTFSYEELVTRNAGFVTPAEQTLLREGRVFVCGVGGMGGAALQSLVRAGVGHFTLADMDSFEVSNLNRQLFATLDTVGQPKVEATRAGLLRINPDVALTAFGAEWVDRLDDILPTHRVVVNGMDDLAAGIALYRKAREHGATVIDAYTAPLPSVTVVHPTAPRPEERLGYPTRDTDWRAITPAQAAACKAAEALYVAVHSSSASYIDHAVAAGVFAGTRARPSFAPRVIETGTLMAFEAVKLLLGRSSGVDHRGVFFNPWTMAVERPRSAPVAWLRERVARRLLARMTA